MALCPAIRAIAKRVRFRYRRGVLLERTTARNHWAWILDSAFMRTLASLVTDFVPGTLIGAERQWHQRTAGLRTPGLVANVLVAIGAAAFTDLGTRLLDAVVAELEKSSQVYSATWSVSTTP